MKDMSQTTFPNYEYSFGSGPLPESELGGEILQGNCRLLLQIYFYHLYGRYFSEDELLNPRAYKSTGEFLKVGYDEGFFENLPDGAVVYAQRLLDREGNPVDHSPGAFANPDDYIIRLHSALYISDISKIVGRVPKEMPIDDSVQLGDPVILHATYVQGSTCVWSIGKFSRYYEPVAAKSFACV